MRLAVRIVIERLVWLAMATAIVCGLHAAISCQERDRRIMEDAAKPYKPESATGFVMPNDAGDELRVESR